MPIKLSTKSFLRSLAFGLLFFVLLSCGGGGGSGSGSANTTTAIYTVSTLNLTYPASDPHLNSPTGIAIDGSDNLFVTDNGNDFVLKITGTTASIFLGNLTPPVLTGQQSPVFLANNCNAQLSVPSAIVIDKANNNTFLTETGGAHGSGWVRAANCTPGAAWDGSEEYGSVSTSVFNQPLGLALDGVGNLYVADTSNNKIQMIAPAGGLPPGGNLSAFAGVGGLGGYVNDVLANAKFNQPYGLAIDAAGAIYVADKANCAIRKISGGSVTTLAGAAPPGACGFQDGTSTTARFSSPTGVAIDGDYLYVADTGNHNIRRITLSTAQVVTIAGATDGSHGTADGTGSIARFWSPTGVAVDSSHNLFVVDTDNNLVRKVTH